MVLKYSLLLLSESLTRFPCSEFYICGSKEVQKCGRCMNLMSETLEFKCRVCCYLLFLNKLLASTFSLNMIPMLLPQSVTVRRKLDLCLLTASCSFIGIQWSGVGRRGVFSFNFPVKNQTKDDWSKKIDCSCSYPLCAVSHMPLWSTASPLVLISCTFKCFFHNNNKNIKHNQM